jgi:hypothetical protein
MTSIRDKRMVSTQIKLQVDTCPGTPVDHTKVERDTANSANLGPNAEVHTYSVLPYPVRTPTNWDPRAKTTLDRHVGLIPTPLTGVDALPVFQFRKSSRQSIVRASPHLTMHGMDTRWTRINSKRKAQEPTPVRLNITLTAGSQILVRLSA